MMKHHEFELLKEICRQLTRIADSMEVKPPSHKQRLKADLSWLEWCYLYLPSEGLRKHIEEMAAELGKLDDETHTD